MRVGWKLIENKLPGFVTVAQMMIGAYWLCLFIVELIIVNVFILAASNGFYCLLFYGNIYFSAQSSEEEILFHEIIFAFVVKYKKKNYLWTSK